MSQVTFDTVEDYIRSNWDDSVRCNLERPGVVSVPIPHTVPSPSGKFFVFFYWDTYFTNVGLLLTDRLDLAKSNCDAMLWWIDEKGFVPNSAFAGDLNRSQPPFLTQMVREVYEVNGDKDWLAGALPRLEKEYAFWMEKRSFPNGLAFHGHHADDEYLEKFYDGLLARRLGVSTEVSRELKLDFAGQLLAEAETGQDFNPMCEHRTLHYASIELNCLIYRMEKNIAFFSSELGKSEEVVAEWEARAEKRKALINELCWDEKAGLFRSRDMIWGKLSQVAHLGSFFPLWAGLATEEQARRTCENLHRFEREFGVAHTEPYSGPEYQWAYPNGWPPTQWVTAKGLANYGFMEDARRVAGKYCEAQRRMFEGTGTMWEKCDVTEGKPAGGEYEADPMLGWTAGVFVAMRRLSES